MPDDLTPFQPGYVHQDDEDDRHTFDLSCLFPNPTDADREYWRRQVAQEAADADEERDRLAAAYVARERHR
jgi:hypothetical protein